MILNAPKISDELLINDIMETEIGTIYFYDSIIIMEAKEDIVLSIRNGLSILLRVIKNVGTKPVVYISNRINEYTVDPNDYRYLELIPNLKGIAIVSYSPRAIEAARLERRFIRRPFQSFGDMKSAKQWATKVLNGKLT